jgi:hypothetical protein
MTVAILKKDKSSIFVTAQESEYRRKMTSTYFLTVNTPDFRHVFWHSGCWLLISGYP